MRPSLLFLFLTNALELFAESTSYGNSTQPGSSAGTSLATSSSSVASSDQTTGTNTSTATPVLVSLPVWTFTWTKAYLPIVGTVFLSISDNVTEAATSIDTAFVSSNTQLTSNGTLNILTRTDVNSAGTVTATAVLRAQLAVALTTITETVLTYPTPLFTIAPSLTWHQKQGVATGICTEIVHSTAVPSHYPLSTIPFSTDPEDPAGWLYVLTTTTNTLYGGSQLSSLLAPGTVPTAFDQCTLGVIAPLALPAGYVQPASGLLVTSVVVLTISTQDAAVVTSAAVPANGVGSSVVAPTSTTSELSTGDSSTGGVNSATRSVIATPSSASPAGASSAAALTTGATPTAQADSDPDAGSESVSSTTNPAAGAGASATGQGGLSTSSEAQTHAGTSLNTQPLNQQTTAQQPSIVLGTDTFTADSASQYLVSGQTLAPGSAITLGSGTSATVVALQTSQSQTQLVVGSSTSIISAGMTPSTESGAPAFTIAGSAVTPDSASRYIISGETLAPGSPITLGSGTSTTVVVLQTSASQTLLIVGSSTSTIPPTSPTTTNPIVIASVTLTPLSSNQYLVSDQTLSPNHPLTLGSGTSTTVVALQTSASQTLLIVGSSTSTLHPSPTPLAISPLTYTGYAVGTQTLQPGGSAVVVSGTTYSLAANGSELVVGSSTEVLTAGAGFGGYIWSALGAPSPAGASPTTGLTGSGTRAVGTMASSSRGATSSAAAAASTTLMKSGGDGVRPGCAGMVLGLVVTTLVFWL